MEQLGMIINFKDETLEWDGIALPMGDNGFAPGAQLHQMCYIPEEPALKQMEERMDKMKDSDYSKVDVDEMCNDLDTADDLKEKLKMTLKKFPTLFGGGLGHLTKIDPIDIDLKPEVKPYHCRAACPVPKACVL